MEPTKREEQGMTYKLYLNDSVTCDRSGGTSQITLLPKSATKPLRVPNAYVRVMDHPTCYEHRTDYPDSISVLYVIFLYVQEVVEISNPLSVCRSPICSLFFTDFIVSHQFETTAAPLYPWLVSQTLHRLQFRAIIVPGPAP